MNEDDVTYYRQRADAELQRAQQATKPKVVAVHYQLAQAYIERVGPGDRPQAEHG